MPPKPAVTAQYLKAVRRLPPVDPNTRAKILTGKLRIRCALAVNSKGYIEAEGPVVDAFVNNRECITRVAGVVDSNGKGWRAEHWMLGLAYDEGRQRAGKPLDTPWPIRPSAMDFGREFPGLGIPREQVAPSPTGRGLPEGVAIDSAEAICNPVTWASIVGDTHAARVQHAAKAYVLEYERGNARTRRALKRAYPDIETAAEAARTLENAGRHAAREHMPYDKKLSYGQWLSSRQGDATRLVVEQEVSDRRRNGEGETALKRHSKFRLMRAYQLYGERYSKARALGPTALQALHAKVAYSIVRRSKNYQWNELRRRGFVWSYASCDFFAATGASESFMHLDSVAQAGIPTYLGAHLNAHRDVSGRTDSREAERGPQFEEIWKRAGNRGCRCDLYACPHIRKPGVQNIGMINVLPFLDADVIWSLPSKVYHITQMDFGHFTEVEVAVDDSGALVQRNLPAKNGTATRPYSAVGHVSGMLSNDTREVHGRPVVVQQCRGSHDRLGMSTWILRFDSPPVDTRDTLVGGKPRERRQRKGDVN